MTQVMLLDCYSASDDAKEHYGRWLAQAAGITIVKISRGDLPVDPTGYAGVVVTGSAASMREAPPWVGGALDTLQRALHADIPVLGCCFGHQLLAAAAADDEAVVRRRSEPELGYLEIMRTPQADRVVGALPERFRTFVSHEDEVAPHSAYEILATSEACEVHALRVPGRRAWGVQFHVEYPRKEEERILRYRRVKHPDVAPDPDEELARAADTDPLARALFSAFLREALGG
jgi:GMP synthase (glutamine-hydrolysing)